MQRIPLNGGDFYTAVERPAHYYAVAGLAAGIGAGSLLLAAFTRSDSLSQAERMRLSDEHNQRLRRSLGLEATGPRPARDGSRSAWPPIWRPRAAAWRSRAGSESGPIQRIGPLPPPERG